MTEALLIAIVAAVFLAAGLVKGALGLGLPTVAMGLLGLVMTPAAAAALLFLPSLLTNAWQALDGRAAGDLIRRIWPMLAASFVATVAASPILAGGASGAAQLGLGVALVVYGVSGLAQWQIAVPARAEPAIGIGIGAATGLVTGATGVFVWPAVPYLAGIGLGGGRLVQAMGLSFTSSTLALGLGLWLNGAVTPGASWASALALLPALAGMRLGAVLRARISNAAFRRLFFTALIGLGAHGILRAL